MAFAALWLDNQHVLVLANKGRLLLDLTQPAPL